MVVQKQEIQKRAWWNPKTWGQAKTVTYQKLTDGTHQYLFKQANGFGNFKSCFQGAYTEENLMTLFNTIPEVFAPIDLIAQTVSNGNFTLRKKSDDSIVENNETWNKFSKQPNWRQTFRRFIYLGVVYKYVTGNRYLYKHLPGTLRPKPDNISALWWLPSQYVWPVEKTTRPKFFVTTQAKDLLDSYELRYGLESDNFAPYLIHHDIFIDTSSLTAYDWLKGTSPLKPSEYPMSNLMAVYEARNVIYVKRGVMGYIVSAKKDDSGTIALTEGEKKIMREELQADFGLTHSKDQIGIIDSTVDFINVGMSIKDLEPFTETKASAAAIYGNLNVDFDLAPSGKGNTFENKAGAMKRLYQDVSIPEGNLIADILTKHIGFDTEDMYIHVDYSHIECLQEDQGKEATTKSTLNTTLKVMYEAGIINKAEWKTELGYEVLPGDELFIGDIKTGGEPLASKIGVGGVTALMQVLTAQLSAEAKQAALEIIFGLTPEQAAQMAVEPQNNNNEQNNSNPKAGAESSANK